ncbi:MAG: SigE family RNA polymerase sigma factor [Microthrixaceae bacterium]
MSTSVDPRSLKRYVLQDSADDSGFRGFYERLQPRAIAVARRLIGDTALAEDIAAESFARAYARWGKVCRHPNPEAWLLRVVGNLAIDSLRRESRRPQVRQDSARPDPSGDSAALRIDLTDAMQHLSGRQQEVIVLRYLIDLPEEEVASALGMSNGSVKTHLHRATTKLRNEMKQPDQPDQLDQPAKPTQPAQESKNGVSDV